MGTRVKGTLYLHPNGTVGSSSTEPISHRGQPQLCLCRRHRYRHHVRHERQEVLDMLLVPQN